MKHNNTYKPKAIQWISYFKSKKEIFEDNRARRQVKRQAQGSCKTFKMQRRNKL